jgi:two-component system sensor histidine kinase MprB
VSFRTRISLLVGACVALAVAVSAVAAYGAVREKLRGQVDSALRDSLRLDQNDYPPYGRGPFRLRGRSPFSGDIFAQLVDSQGNVLGRQPANAPNLPVPKFAAQLTASPGQPRYFDARADGQPVRVIAVGTQEGFIVEAARSVAEVNQLLDWLQIVFFLIAAAGVAVAAFLGFLVGRAALKPVQGLIDEAEEVRATGDLSRRVDPSGGREFERLGTSFNAMLGALELSRNEQRQLVADASHELRTPLTSLRTNMEVIDRMGELSPESRARLVHDLHSELDELTALVSDLVELAGEGSQKAEPEPVQLDALVEDVIGRVRRRSPRITLDVVLQPTVVRGVPAQLERAIGNLLDNAVKWSPPDGVVEVRVADGEVSVRDHGPGIAEQDLPHVFDRFWRASEARGLPGSGLGLAIVRKIADEHGATIVPEQADGGGTVMRLTLPVLQDETSTVLSPL